MGPVMSNSKINKIVLAYSGGLDTSVMLHWLQNKYECEIITFTADLGQNEDLSNVHSKAISTGASDSYIEDLQEEFVKDFVFPMFRSNAVYEAGYLLGTAIARPLIAKKQIELAAKTGANAVAHGATGKGTDQVRLEFGYYGCNPDINVLSPWREWDFQSRDDLLEYAMKHNIQIDNSSKDKPPFSIDANILHTSYEGGELENPWVGAENILMNHITFPESAPDMHTYVDIGFVAGDPVSVSGESLKPVELLRKLNELGSQNGIGCLDLVENRYVGMKSRGIYHTPGGTILLAAHKAIETITLDRDSMHLKNKIMHEYADLVYNGYWWGDARKMLQALIDKSQENVNGTVRLKLYKGNVYVDGRRSENSLYSEDIVSFHNSDHFDMQDASGFIKLCSLGMRMKKNK